MHAKTRIIPISIRRTRKSPSPRPSPLLYSRSRTQIAHRPSATSGPNINSFVPDYPEGEPRG